MCARHNGLCTTVMGGWNYGNLFVYTATCGWNWLTRRCSPLDAVAHRASEIPAQASGGSGWCLRHGDLAQTPRTWPHGSFIPEGIVSKQILQASEASAAFSDRSNVRTFFSSSFSGPLCSFCGFAFGGNSASGNATKGFSSLSMLDPVPDPLQSSTPLP